MTNPTNPEAAAGRPLTFAIDFDDTLTACPELWRSFIATMTTLGHKAIIVTARRDTSENRQDINEWMAENNLTIPITYTKLGSKLDHMKRLGIKVDIWIDDSPETLVHGH